MDFIVKICSPPSMFIAIDISAIDCSLLAGRSSKQRPRASIRDVSMLDLLIESGIFYFIFFAAAAERSGLGPKRRDGRWRRASDVQRLTLATGTKRTRYPAVWQDICKLC